MKNNEEGKQLQIVMRKVQPKMLRNGTPFRTRTELKSRGLDKLVSSPEARVKRKNAIAMIEQVKRSLTPLKFPELAKVKSSKVLPAFRLDPELQKEVTKMSFKEYGIGNEYAKVLSRTVKELTNLRELNLRSNRIEDEGAYRILSSLDKGNMKRLDISHNPLGASAVDALVNMLTTLNAGIERLSLENTRLSLKSFTQIITALQNNSSLQELNLANNKLGHGCGAHLKELLSQSTSLKKLDLHWNLFRGSEAVLLFAGLEKNDSLLALDLSWNSFGSDSSVIDSLCSFLRSETQLRHLDISHNRISYESSVAISKACLKNRSILGIHIEGNNCEINSLGFIKPTREIAVPTALVKSARILRTPRRINDTCCWICNKYLDFVVKWDPGQVEWEKGLKKLYRKAKERRKEPVFLHLEIDEFEPFLMEKRKDGVIECKRAVPQGKAIRFFFSYRGNAQISNDYQIEPLDPPLVKTVKHGTGQCTELVTDKLNTIIIYDGKLTCRPRPEIKAYVIESIEASSALESEWSIERSQFANYVWDSNVRIMQEVLNNCFEFDWQNSKIHRMIKSTTIRDQIKEVVRPYYKYMYELYRKKTYKFYAAIGTNGNIFSINLALLTEIIQKCEVFDKNFKISDLDLSLKASKFSLTSVNTAYGIVRHEFLEFLIRIALDKYFRSGICKTEEESIVTFFDRNFMRNIKIYDQDKWRWDRLFTHEAEDVLKENRDVLQTVFELNSGKKSKPGEKKFMLIEDFIGLCQFHGILNEVFNLRQATICFHMALMTHVDEINSQAYMQAGKAEFIEAIARVADFLNAEDPEKEMISNGYSSVPLHKNLAELIGKHFIVYKNLKRSVSRISNNSIKL
jgi:hypothetical protein